MKYKGLKFTSIMVILVLAMILAVACGQAKNESTDNTETTNNTDSNETESQTEVAEIKTMTGEELEEQNSAKKKDEVLIIDVRSEEDYKAGHIPNAINIFVDELEGRLSEIEDYKDKPIIVYCNSGKKSTTAAEILVNNGFTDVTNAEGVKQYEYDLVHYTDVRGAAFEELIAENDSIILVDVRPADQVNEEGMISGAINIPYDQIESNLEKLTKDKTIAVYCNTGTKSAEAAKTLEDLGYENVVNSIEGVKEYPFALSK